MIFLTFRGLLAESPQTRPADGRAPMRVRPSIFDSTLRAAVAYTQATLNYSAGFRARAFNQSSRRVASPVARLPSPGRFLPSALPSFLQPPSVFFPTARETRW